MGVSTDGKLFYGICFEEREEEEEFELKNVPEYDEEDYSGPMQFLENECEDKEVIISSHCSYDYPMYYVAITSTNYTASRGCPKEIKDFAVQDD